jgi:hypothetical protein
MKTIFSEFVFAYLLAECHDKVAKIIFYFARAVRHATVERDRLSFFLVSARPVPSDKPTNRCNLNTVAVKLTTPEAGKDLSNGAPKIKL